ncbi:MAG: DUF2478 domain-containing protein [Roseiarcus sp.]
MSAWGLDPNRIAAVIYEDGAAVDLLMTTFARELVERGVDATGIVQLPPDEAGCGAGALMKLMAVESGEILPLCQDLGPGAGSCCLDTSALASASRRLRDDASRPSDILFVSKFGKQEANGKGFRDEIAYAVGEGRLVLTAVKRNMLERWLEFTGGQGTLLEARLWVLRDWFVETARGRRAAA